MYFWYFTTVYYTLVLFQWCVPCFCIMSKTCTQSLPRKKSMHHNVPQKMSISSSFPPTQHISKLGTPSSDCFEIGYMRSTFCLYWVQTKECISKVGTVQNHIWILESFWCQAPIIAPLYPSCLVSYTYVISKMGTHLFSSIASHFGNCERFNNTLLHG